MTADRIARLLVTLDDVEPAVRRRLDVPLAIRLDRLHLVLQAALGWENGHLHEFRAGRAASWGEPDPDFGPGPPDARRARLSDLLDAAGRKAPKYLYDFGDNWEHTLKVERVTDAEPGVLYPVLAEAQGRCPPEDIGGSWGYDAFLAALADPDHERHDEMLEWAGEGFDPGVVDTDALAAKVATLAKAWATKAASRRTSTK